jgi:hypothetical protein
MPWLGLFVALPARPMSRILLIGRQPAHPVFPQNPVHRRPSYGEAVKALEVVGDLAGADVIALSEAVSWDFTLPRFMRRVSRRSVVSREGGYTEFGRSGMTKVTLATLFLVPTLLGGGNPSNDSVPCAAYALMVPREPKGKIRMSKPQVPFDVNGHGVLELVRWPQDPANLAFLAIDKNANGLIDDGRELFTEYSTPGAPNGFTALVKLFEEEYEVPINSMMNAATHEKFFERLLLWSDLNRDGETQPGEFSAVTTRVSVIAAGYYHDDASPAITRSEAFAQYRGEVRAAIYEVCLATGVTDAR